MKYWPRLLRSLAKQPVAVRAALITVIAGSSTLIAVDWLGGRRDEQVRIEELRIGARTRLADELIPQFRSLQDLTRAVMTSLRISGEPDSTTIASLQSVAEEFMVSQSGIRTRLDAAYGDSVGLRYTETTVRADSLFHALTLFPVRRS